MPATKVQLSGGSFDAITGNALSNGYLTMELSQDATVNTSTAIGSKFSVTIQLDVLGNVVASPPQYVWPNDVLTPINTVYIVSAYQQTGQLVWGPSAVSVLSTPSPFNISAWIP